MIREQQLVQVTVFACLPRSPDMSVLRGTDMSKEKSLGTYLLSSNDDDDVVVEMKDIYSKARLLRSDQPVQTVGL